MSNSEIVKRFGKFRLLDIAQELEIDVNEATHSLGVAQSIIDSLEGDGIPDEMSDDLFDLCVAQGYIDEEGNLLVEEDDAEPDEPEADDEPEDGKEPTCWTMKVGEPGDPACKQCKFLKNCFARRQENRPACFGKLYDPNNEDCKICIEWKYCKSVVC